MSNRIESLELKSQDGSATITFTPHNDGDIEIAIEASGDPDTYFFITPENVPALEEWLQKRRKAGS